MVSITITADDGLLKQVREYAAEHNTTIEALTLELWRKLVVEFARGDFEDTHEQNANRRM